MGCWGLALEYCVLFGLLFFTIRMDFTALAFYVLCFGLCVYCVLEFEFELRLRLMNGQHGHVIQWVKLKLKL